MRHRKHTFKIGRTSSHRRAMLANMACSLIVEKQIKTTLVRAKELRRVVEKMITLGKRGSLHARRQAIAFLRHPAVVRELFNEVAPKQVDRPGGYTRIMKLGQRAGDAAEMCLIQIIDEPVQAKAKAASGKMEEAVAEAVEEMAEVSEEAVAETAAGDAQEEKAE